MRRESSIQAAWGESSGLGTDLSEHPIGEDIKPWEGFRGWSPRVSYGQSPLGLNANPKSTPVYPNNDKNDDVKTWEGFRGWSPRVPYGN